MNESTLNTTTDQNVSIKNKPRLSEPKSYDTFQKSLNTNNELINSKPKEIVVKKYEVPISNYETNDNYNNVKFILAKSGLHYCDLNYDGQMNNKAKITFNVRDSVDSDNKNYLNSKLNNIQEKIKSLGMELNEVNKKQENKLKTNDILPCSVKWNTKPIIINKNTLNTGYNNYNKGNNNVESEGNTLGKSYKKIKSSQSFGM